MLVDRVALIALTALVTAGIVLLVMSWNDPLSVCSFPVEGL